MLILAAYIRQCNGHAGVCDSCQVPGFRVWPSELGCRRERLDSLVLLLVPGEDFSCSPTLSLSDLSSAYGTKAAISTRNLG
jgi:hypothetical protein